MRLTYLTDYAFRTLIYLATHAESASLDQISQTYGISRNHLIKAVNVLQHGGFITTRRGVGGGIWLARVASEIRLGDVVRCTERDFDLVECFNSTGNTCVIDGACKLKKILHDANLSFLDVLDSYSLEDITSNPKALLALIARSRG